MGEVRRNAEELPGEVPDGPHPGQVVHTTCLPTGFHHQLDVRDGVDDEFKVGHGIRVEQLAEVVPAGTLLAVQLARVLTGIENAVKIEEEYFRLRFLSVQL